jgi:myxalamid-type polyketide synthase MxaB
VQAVDPWQAPLWGLGKVIALEHPELHPVCLDLAALSHNSHDNYHEAQLLFHELSTADFESQIAYREDIRYVARLGRHEGAVTGYNNEAVGDFTVKLGRYGLLDELYLAPLSRPPLGAGEVELQVRATGLNFRDVLRALGMLQEVEGAIGIYSARDAWFGLECAGVISRVGAEVAGLEVGDEVIAALAKGSLGSFVTVSADFVLPKPKGLTDEEGATIPIAFLTAYYGLYELAKLQAGERVLIHSAAGGVGQAAVQLAQLAGAEVFATASPSKWGFLRSMGVEHIMNSRTLAFADEVMELTGGQGVDVVLNSLNGDFIDKSFEALGKGGRFIELGKIGIWDDAQVQERRPDIEYLAFDLGEVAEETPALIASMLGKLKPLFTQRAGCEEHKSLKPLPLKSFPTRNVVDAFRYMAQAKHIGKVVIKAPSARRRQSNGAMERRGEGARGRDAAIRSNASYLITGGLGALGLELADWLVEQGARYLVLTGRSKPSEAAKSRLEALREAAAGATVMVMAADVTHRGQMSALLGEIKRTLPPLRGIIHAAGLLDDGILLEQDRERFERVMAPKVQGSWNLHLLTEGVALDFFVLFSSAAAFVGSAGQGNYAAANSFMDALAHHRRSQGLPALSINWGPWANAGMATSEQVSRRLAAQGWQPMTPEVGLKVFGELLKQRQAATQLGVLPINWPQFLAQRDPSPLFEAFTALESQSADGSAESYEAKPELMTQLSSAPLGERRELLEAYVRSAIGRVLGIHNTAQIEDRQRLFDLGLDSLTAVELRRRLEAGLDCGLRSTLLFHYPTIEALVDHLLETVLAEFFRDEEAESTEEAQSLLAHLLYDEHPAASEISDEIEDDEEGSLDDIAQLLAASLGIEME